MTRRRLSAAIMGAGTLAAGLGALYAEVLRRPLPRTRGVTELAGLGAAAEVVRDAWGVPHIRAATLADAYVKAMAS